MRVVVIASLAESLVTFRGALIKAMTERGSSVLGVAPEEQVDEGFRQRLTEKGAQFQPVSMERAGLNPIQDIQTACELFWLLRRDKPDIVLAYTVKPVVWGLLAARLAGVPHRFALITGLGYAFTSGGRGVVSVIVRLLYRLSLSKTKRVFFQNPDDLALFQKLRILRESAEPVLVNGSGVDLRQFSEVPLSEQCGFLLTARLLGDKGVREYVAAACQVKRAFPETKFYLVGWIDENPDAIDKAELDGWIEEGVIHYLGRLQDVRPAIRRSCVFVLPSYREGTPRSVLEAMAMGRAIITTDAPGCRETVIDGENGFLVPVKDVDALAQAMLKFIEEPELIASMGKRSREIAEEKYDVNKVNAVMLREMGL